MSLALFSWQYVIQLEAVIDAAVNSEVGKRNRLPEIIELQQAIAQRKQNCEALEKEIQELRSRRR